MPPTVEAWSLNHWTAREVPHSTIFHFSFLSCLWFYLRANAFCPPLPLATACASGVLGALLLLALLVLPPGHWLLCHVWGLLSCRLFCSEGRRRVGRELGSRMSLPQPGLWGFQASLLSVGWRQSLRAPRKWTEGHRPCHCLLPCGGECFCGQETAVICATSSGATVFSGAVSLAAMAGGPRSQALPPLSPQFCLLCVFQFTYL